MKKNDGLLVCHATGLGKTLTAITASQCFLDENNKDGMVLVVCPTSVVEQFKHQLIKFYGGKDMDRYDIMSYNNMRINKDFVNCKNKFLILDEVQTIKNYKSETYKSIMDCAMLCKKRLLLTATPYVNDLRDFIPIINIMHGDKSIAGSEYPIKGKLIDGPKKFYINHKEPLHKNEEFAKLCVKYLKIHFVENKDSRFFPKLDERYVEVKMNKEWEKKYKTLISSERVFDLQFSQPDKFYNGHRRAVNNVGGDEYFTMKLSSVLDTIKNGKTLIYTNWLDFGLKPIEEFLKENNITYASFFGGVNMMDRLKLINKFNNDEVDVLIITSAGGEGIDLKGVRNIIVLDPVWNYAKLRQIIGRGVRYKSHAHLPECDRKVNVLKMVLLEERMGNDWLEVEDDDKSVSGDAILYKIIERKRNVTDDLKKMYESLSI